LPPIASPSSEVSRDCGLACVCVRAREGGERIERQTSRQRDRKKERDRKREKEKEREIEAVTAKTEHCSTSKTIKRAQSVADRPVLRRSPRRAMAASEKRPARSAVAVRKLKHRRREAKKRGR
jgi:hypothetical protein